MQINRNYSVLIHILIIFFFIYLHSSAYFLMIIAPILHFLVIYNDSSCHPNHCQIHIQRRFKEERLCQICKLDEWIRMKHCYKCNRCIHKYDHHCFLMGICIGQFNHKYYLLFLYAYLINTGAMLSTFHEEIRNQVSIDGYGIQSLSGKYYFYALSMIILYFNAFLGTYLSLAHTWFMVNNITTWQRAKRDSISYLMKIKPEISFPFSKGFLNNVYQFFTTNDQHPIEWKINC